MKNSTKFSAGTLMPSTALRKAYQDPKKGFNHLVDLIRYAHRRIPSYTLLYLIYAVKRLRRRDYIVVIPEPPGRRSSLWKICMAAGIRMVGEREHRHLQRSYLTRIRHVDETRCEVVPHCLNGRCSDISKIYVDSIFTQIFGYSSQIDPTTFCGQAVIKSDENFSGGGEFIDCPIRRLEVNPTMIYQKPINNLLTPNTVREYRVCIIGSHIVDVLIQDRDVRKRLKGRGSGYSRGAFVQPAEKIFDREEINKILQFCDCIGLEFGELDILPDFGENRNYILDANKTPSYMVSGTAFNWFRFSILLKRANHFRKSLHKST